MKVILFVTALAFVALIGQSETAVAQSSALVNPPACKLSRCLRYCVHWRTQGTAIGGAGAALDGKPWNEAALVGDLVIRDPAPRRRKPPLNCEWSLWLNRNFGVLLDTTSPVLNGRKSYESRSPTSPR